MQRPRTWSAVGFCALALTGPTAPAVISKARRRPSSRRTARAGVVSNYAVLATTQSALVYFSVGVQGPFDTSIALVADHFGFGPANTFTDLLFKNGFE